MVGEIYCSTATTMPSNGFNGYHTTTIGGKVEPTRARMLALAAEVGLQKQRAETIAEEITTKIDQAHLHQ